MITLASRNVPRGLAARDLVAVWLTVAGVLTYLDVPLRHSPLFATNLVLQASLGTVVITGLLRGLAPSLLLFCGPGLVLGGAMSFAVYQAFGRGTLGAGISACIGIVALVHVLRRNGTWAADGLRWWQLGQVTGMAMLALSSEFGELLPAAVLLFLLGFVNSPSRISRPIVVRAANLIGLGIAVAMWSLRQNYWWLVTDDYLFFEVVSRHITREGPFASWGVNNFARYHWLSYGWAGVLDVMSGTPTPLVTLTRVMPFAYTVSMTSSVLLILKQRRPALTTSSILLAWAVVAVGRFSWAGTSTGGVYALLAAAMLLGMMALEIRAHWSRKALLGLLVMVAIALTKFPSVFAVLLVSIIAISVLGTAAIIDRFLGRFVRWVSLAIAIPLVLVAIWITSQLLDEQFAVVSMNPSLGQLSTLGIPFVAFTLVIKQLWLWIAALLFMFEMHKTVSRSDRVSSWLVPTCLLALLAGLLCELLISSNADDYTYFSGPFYFVASLSFLFLGSSNRSGVGLRPSLWGQLAVVVPLFGAGLLWGLTELRRSTWLGVFKLASINPYARLEVLLLYTADPRIGIALIAGILLTVLPVLSRRTTWIGAWLTTLVVLSFTHLRPHSIAEFRRERTTDEIYSFFGSDDEREVGNWIRNNTDSVSIIATNSLFRGSSDTEFGSNFSLATWSQREFLVLGPKFASGTKTSANEISLCIRFAQTPSLADLNSFHKFGVHWFIVDTSVTQRQNFTAFGEVVFNNDRFLVLRLFEPQLG